MNGVTATLERIDLYEKGFRVRVIVSPPPGYAVSGTPPRPAVAYQSTADYYLDGGWGLQAGISAVEYRTDGMVHTWSVPGAIPAETAEMLFSIRVVGETAGPWQFLVALK